MEGQYDVIKAYEKGIRNIVALGNSKLSSFQLNLILRHVDSIFVLLDNDEAGQEGAELIIERVPVRGRCRNCQHEFNIESIFFLCPNCQNANVEVIQGDELLLESLEVE